MTVLPPAHVRRTFVGDKGLQLAGNYGFKYNGDSSLFQFCFLGTAQYQLKIMENISLISSASVFSQYLDHPERLVLSYEGVFNMKSNKYISSLITFDLIYDHNQIKKTQLKRTLGFGLSHNINNGVKRPNRKDNQTWK